MASYEVRQAFKRAAENILDRRITDAELDRIISAFESASGTTFDRAIKGIAGGVNLTEQVVRSKAAASDDADRVMRDIERELGK